KKGSVVFVVSLDGREAARSPVLRGGMSAQKLVADLRGAQRMVLKVEDGGDGIDHDHADWAGALIVRSERASARPDMIVPPAEAEAVIAPFNRDELAIHSPHVVGTTPGRPFVFRIPARGVRPIQFGAARLPDGLTLDAESGIITGSVARE